MKIHLESAAVAHCGARRIRCCQLLLRGRRQPWRLESCALGRGVLRRTRPWVVVAVVSTTVVALARRHWCLAAGV